MSCRAAGGSLRAQDVGGPPSRGGAGGGDGGERDQHEDADDARERGGQRHQRWATTPNASARSRQPQRAPITPSGTPRMAAAAASATAWVDSVVRTCPWVKPRTRQIASSRRLRRADTSSARTGDTRSRCRVRLPTRPWGVRHPARPGGSGRSNPLAGCGGAPGPRSTRPTRGARSPWDRSCPGGGGAGNRARTPVTGGASTWSGCGRGQRRSVRTCGSAGRSRAASPWWSSAPATRRAPGPEAARPARSPTLESVGGRAAHTASTLPDGRVLVAGGCIDDGCATATDEVLVVSPDGRSVMRRAPLVSARDGHTATVLPDGRVVLVGGFAGEGVGALGSVEVLAPHGGAASELGELTHARGGHAAVLARRTGGCSWSAAGWAPAPTRPPRRSSIPTPARSWPARTSPSPVTRWTPSRSATGGSWSSADRSRRDGPPTCAAVLDPGGAAWRAVGPMGTPRLKHTLVALRDGRALVLGGSPDDETLLETTELFDPDTERFTAGPRLHEPRYKLPGGAVVLGDHVVVAGGGDTVEDLDLGTGRSRVLAEQPVRGSFATINRLGRRDLLVIGGYDARIRLRREAFVLPAPAQVMTGHASAVPPAERGRSGPSSHASSIGPPLPLVRSSTRSSESFRAFATGSVAIRRRRRRIRSCSAAVVRDRARSRGPATGRASGGRPGGGRGTGRRRCEIAGLVGPEPHDAHVAGVAADGEHAPAASGRARRRRRPGPRRR